MLFFIYSELPAGFVLPTRQLPVGQITLETSLFQARSGSKTTTMKKFAPLKLQENRAQAKIFKGAK